MDSDLLPADCSTAEYATEVKLQKMFALSLAERVENGKRLNDEDKEFIVDALRYYAEHASTRRPPRSRGKPRKYSHNQIRYEFMLYQRSMSEAQAKTKIQDEHGIDDPRVLSRILTGR